MESYLVGMMVNNKLLTFSCKVKVDYENLSFFDELCYNILNKVNKSLKDSANVKLLGVAHFNNDSERGEAVKWFDSISEGNK
jgi:hypothetical protein